VVSEEEHCATAKVPRDFAVVEVQYVTERVDLGADYPDARQGIRTEANAFLSADWNAKEQVAGRGQHAAAADICLAVEIGTMCDIRLESDDAGAHEGEACAPVQALGIDRIPRLVDTWQLLGIVAVITYIMYSIGKSSIGRAFDAIRQDETVGIALGISIRRYHILAFVLSGAIGGLFGGMQALSVYAIEPSLYGFNFLVAVLTYIVLGGRGSVWGPIIGTAIIVALPEIARPLAEHRQMALGALIVVMINYLPNGVYDSLVLLVRQRRAVRRDKQAQEKLNAIACA